MRVSELLKQIREPWLKRASHSLLRGEEGREALDHTLSRFYDLLLQAIATGDPGWLKPILVEWASLRTEDELLQDDLSLSPVMGALVTETLAVARQNLSPEETNELIEALMPIFTYSYTEIARQEIAVRVSYVTAKLVNVKDELERLDRSKSDFISVAAHELKTPLTLIEGYAAMLREQIKKEEETSPLVLMLRGVDNGTRRLGEIINDMIDVSLIDNDLLMLSFQPTWVNRVVELLVEELTPLAAERSQEFTITPFDGWQEMTYADTERIHQALRNVLTNAIKYTPDGGRIEIGGRKLPGFIEVTVADTGIGIDQEDQSVIFRKFGRLGAVATHSSGKTKFKGGGPGLGLPITKGILEAHGGTIWVESDGYDEAALPGSIFHVLLPLRGEPPDAKAARLFQPVHDTTEI
ncbi:MAG: HAMP domain-containing histidine kinase [Chloroflexi bacterium]|nr:HAMP domain-containing histidine kinase [Chloroflexota bacterium]